MAEHGSTEESSAPSSPATTRWCASR
jgi:hypothetical protein